MSCVYVDYLYVVKFQNTGRILIRYYASYIYVFICVCICTNIHICTCVTICICECICVRMPMPVRTCMHMCMQVRL